MIIASAASPHRQSQETLTTQGWVSLRERVPRSNRITFETQSELNSGDSQHAFVSRNQRASFACVSIVTTHYTARTNATDKKGGKKKKANSPLTCDPGGTKGAALHAYRGGSNRVYDCIISPLPHHLSTHQWTLEATTLEQTDQASLIHSPPRCLCQVIAGGKRKTDQYISHGPDR